MEFNLKKTALWKALKIGQCPCVKYHKVWRNLFLIAGIACLVIFTFGTLTGFNEAILDKLVGGMVVGIALFLFFWELGIFLEAKIKNPKLDYSLFDLMARPEYINLAGYLDYETAAIIKKALKFCRRQKISLPTPEILFYHLIISRTPEINFVFQRAGINKKDLISKSKEAVLMGLRSSQGIGFNEVIFETAKTACADLSRSDKEHRKKRIGVGELLVVLADKCDFLKNFLLKEELNKNDILSLVLWFEKIRKRTLKAKNHWSRENLLKHGSIGKDWSAGFSITLDKYSIDWRNKVVQSGFREIIGHGKTIKQIERVLEKKDINNVLLIGDPGSGRKAAIELLSQRAFLGESSDSINFKRVVQFDPTLLFSRLTSKELAEAELDRCLSEVVRAGNIILVIDEFHNFVGETTKLSSENISGILTRYLPLSSFRLIAITSYAGLHNIVERNPSLLNQFEKVEVAEISAGDTLIFLQNFVPFFERKHKIFIAYKTLREIIRLSLRYLPQIPFPERALRVLDEAVSYLVTTKKGKVLRIEDIKKVVAEKSEVPIESIEAKEKITLLQLEELIHQRIINQEEAVSEVASALRRARAEVQVKAGPMGGFLFLGPTGVGKTETAKALANIYFKSEKRMVRLDMSEFQNPDDVHRLLGTETEEGLLTTPIKENPFSLLLLDEIEKASPNILNLFLQVLDEGWITDGQRRKIDFRNTIIIATSNAGSEIIRESIKQNKEIGILKDELVDYLLKDGVFHPEFINRFDAVVVFKPLTQENLLKIAELILQKIADNLQDKGIKFQITSELKAKMVQLGYNPQFGAREIRRVIQDKVENVLAEAMLSGRLNRGRTARIEVEGAEMQLVIL